MRHDGQEGVGIGGIGVIKGWAVTVCVSQSTHKRRIQKGRLGLSIAIRGPNRRHIGRLAASRSAFHLLDAIVPTHCTCAGTRKEHQ